MTDTVKTGNYYPKDPFAVTNTQQQRKKSISFEDAVASHTPCRRKSREEIFREAKRDAKFTRSSRRRAGSYFNDF